MQEDQEITKQVIESLKWRPCKQDQQELVKQQTLTSNTSQHFLTPAALESAGSSSCTSPQSLLQLPLPLVDIACEPFPRLKQLYKVSQQLAGSDTTARTLLLLLKYWRRQEQKKPTETTGELKVIRALGEAERRAWQGSSLHSSVQAGGTLKKWRFLLEKGIAALITFH